MITITPARQADLPAILAIERAGFSEAEAGSPAAFRDRLEKLPATFLVARTDTGVAGFIVGPAVREEFVTDEMYDRTPRNLPTGGHQLVLSLAVAPDYQGRGIGSQLLAALATVARQAQRTTMSLDSLAANVPFYERNGFQKVNVSPSSHAGETWYRLVKQL